MSETGDPLVSTTINNEKLFLFSFFNIDIFQKTCNSIGVKAFMSQTWNKFSHTVIHVTGKIYKNTFCGDC